MPDPMTDSDLPAIDAMLAAITPGEWRVSPHNGRLVFVVRTVEWPYTDGSGTYQRDVHFGVTDGSFSAPWIDPLPPGEGEANARFIAAAPQLVQRLRDEVVRLRAALTKTKELAR